MFLTIHRVCEVLTSQNQSVQLRLICIYVCPTSAHRGFRCEYRHCKGKVFFDKVSCFNKKKDLGKNSCRTLSKSRSVLLCNIVELHRISLRKTRPTQTVILLDEDSAKKPNAKRGQFNSSTFRGARLNPMHTDTLNSHAYSSRQLIYSVYILSTALFYLIQLTHQGCKN